ncbi:putative RNA-directed DNA polymerase from transposon BS [Trichonephila clavipes]|nr:putative RNA-directed DNA polymerase from transposon BS [Trichonephila clavipes]
MDLRKSRGPDGILGFMIGHLGPHGMQKLLDIFNFSWKIGRLPRDWKRAIIIPILKPGKDTSTSVSYRTIALTSFVSKLMERLVLARLNVHLNINGLVQVSSMVTEKAMGRLIRSCIFAREFGTHRIRNPPTTQLQPYWICPEHFTEFGVNF